MAAAIPGAEAFLDLRRQFSPKWEGWCEIRQVAAVAGGDDPGSG